MCLDFKGSRGACIRLFENIQWLRLKHENKGHGKVEASVLEILLHNFTKLPQPSRSHEEAHNVIPGGLNRSGETGVVSFSRSLFYIRPAKDENS